MSEAVKWPDHEWAGDKYGHACADCTRASPWYCDPVAHRLGETDRSLKLLNAIEESE